MTEKQITVAEALRKIVSEQLHIAAETISTESTLTALGADSLDVVEIIMRVEDQFRIEVNDAAAEKLHTFGDLVAYITQLT